MPILKNPKHERFAQALADGKSQIEAYAAAGYARNRGNAATLKRRESISRRVNELLAERERMARDATERATAELALTKADVMRLLLQRHDAASAAGQHSAAIRALELLGKQLGMFIDRKEMRVIRSLSDLSEEELDALIADAGADERKDEPPDGAAN